MPTIFNPKRRNAIFINTGGTVSPTPAPPSFSNTKSLAFDGVDETIDLGLISELNNTSSYTLSMWVNPSVLSGLQYLFALVTSGTERIYIFLNNTIPNVGMSNGTNTNESFNSAPLTIDTWYHLAVVFDGTQTGADRITFYLNGVAETTTKTTWDSTTPTFVTNAFLSNYAQFGLYYFDGNMDEVAIFNTALTSDNINDIYSGGTPNDLSDLNPVAWYRMGDNSTYQTPQILMPENTNKNKISNYSLDFDGVDDYVDCGTSSVIASASSYSISAWVKIDTGGAFFSSGTLNIDRTYLAIDSSNVYFAVKTGSGGVISWSNSFTNTWYHIVGVVDAGTSYLYVDGIQRATGSVSTLSPTAGNNVKIGNTTAPMTSNPYSGKIDELTIWDNALNSTQVSELYNGGEPTTISGASAYYKLGEQSKFTDNWLVPNSALSNYSKYSFNFDGVDDYLDIANNTTIARTQNISYSIWINLTANTRQYLVGNWNSSNGGTGISIESGDVLVFQLADGTNDSFFNSRVTSFSTYAPAGSWHHILGTFDGTDAKIYINGILRNTWTPTAPYTISGWNPFRIGWRGAGLTLLTTGKLDEIGLFDTAINLSAVWDGSSEPKDITSVSGIVSNWRMGEDATYNSSTSKWTIPDQVGSNNGTSSNTMALNTLVGEAPNYIGGGLSDAMTIEDRVGDAPNSNKNAVSYNMEAIDIDNNTP